MIEEFVAIVPKAKRQIFLSKKGEELGKYVLTVANKYLITIKSKISIIELDELKQIITEKIRVNDHNCFYEISQKNKTCIAFSNTNVINNGSIQNNEEIKDGELIFAELETYLDEA
ncbi:unnamed protein product [Rhizophagus irregularis]|nr:unnamed protein product [Rhizophagus irregularis]